MSGTSRRTRIVAIRLPVEDIERIKKTINGQLSPETSVSSYCKTAVQRYLRRHDGDRKSLGNTPQ